MIRNLLGLSILILAGCAGPHDYEAARVHYTAKQATAVMSGGAQSIRLQKGHEGRLYLSARMGETTLRMLVDSGATMTIIERNLLAAEGLEIMAAPRGVFWGGGGAVDAGVARVPYLDLGGCGLSDCPVVAIDFTDWNRRESAAQGVAIQGILGSAHLELLGVKIDYATGEMTVTERDAAAASESLRSAL